MDLTIARCFVTVTDPDKALAFYRDVLGLELVMDVPNGDFRWITVGSKSQPGVQIVLSNYIQGSPEDLSYVAGLVAKGALNAVHFAPTTWTGCSSSSPRPAPRSSRSRPASRGVPATVPYGTPRGT